MLEPKIPQESVRKGRSYALQNLEITAGIPWDQKDDCPILVASDHGDKDKHHLDTGQESKKLKNSLSKREGKVTEDPAAALH